MMDTKLTLYILKVMGKAKLVNKVIVQFQYHIQGMKFFVMFMIATKKNLQISIKDNILNEPRARLIGQNWCNISHCINKSPLELKTRYINKNNVLNGTITSNSYFMTFCRKPTPNTKRDTIRIMFLTNFKLVTKYACTCKGRNSYVNIEISYHFYKGFTLLPRLCVKKIEQNLPPFLNIHPIFNVTLL